VGNHPGSTHLSGGGRRRSCVVCGRKTSELVRPMGVSHGADLVLPFPRTIGLSFVPGFTGLPEWQRLQAESPSNCATCTWPLPLRLKASRVGHRCACLATERGPRLREQRPRDCGRGIGTGETTTTTAPRLPVSRANEARQCVARIAHHLEEARAPNSWSSTSREGLAGAWATNPGRGLRRC